MLECGMLERDSRALRKRSAVLCKQLVVDELLIQLLQAEDILTESMAESIMAEPTSHKRSWRLLLLLPKRGPRALAASAQLCEKLSSSICVTCSHNHQKKMAKRHT
ncbi:Caspase-2 [Larimichthys crocea]|uniref:Uncharacterized protein n=1 Tax=Larimichthys crocea TaxID=215358 RepID=A0ACD3QUQ3_LARCR|nr:Caspase-2 [Larimichthys crocea]